MLSGSTNIQYLVKNNVRIWSEWPWNNYIKSREKALLENDLFKEEYEKSVPNYSLKEFEKQVADNDVFAKQWGDIGRGGYGKLFRNFNGIDQLKDTQHNLTNNPFSRRHVISLWNPALLKDTLLPACHHNHVYNCVDMTTDERRDYMWRHAERYEGTSLEPEELEDVDMDDLNIPKIRLNLSLFMRSSCVGLGLPFNIAQYALLLSMFAHCLNYDVGELMWTGVDVHLYSNLIDPIKAQLSREPYALPTLALNPQVTDITNFKFSDITLNNYKHHDRIKMDVTI